MQIADTILEDLYNTRDELIAIYVKSHHKLITLHVPVEDLLSIADDYERVLYKINKAIENQIYLDARFK